jgi:hypothetical protein
VPNGVIVIIHIQVHTITYKYIHKFTNTINIDIAIYNLQVHALYVYEVQLFNLRNITQVQHIFTTSKSFNKK